MVTLSAEERELSYIRACLRAHLFGEAAFPAPPEDLDWDQFQRCLLQNQLGGLFVVLGRVHPESMPRGVKDQLREERFRQLLYTDWCAQQAKVLLDSLQELSIPVIVLKGWALVQLVYDGDYSQRPASDIDLLVRPGDAGKVSQVLHNLDYGDYAMEPWPGYFQRFVNSSHFVSKQTYPGTDKAFNIDLHWGFPDPPYYDRRIALEALFERAKSITIEGVEVGSLAVEDTVIYASVHNAHHGYRETLSRYYDLAALILQAGSSLDWEALLGNAAAWRVTLPLRRTLMHLDALWPGVIPPSVMGRLPGLKSSLSERLVDWGLSRSTNKEAANILLSCWNTPGLLWRTRFFLETAFPGPAYLRHYFGIAPGNLWPLLYFRRFYRFIKG